MYCGGPPDQMLDLNWNQTMDANGHFESALSSIVSSQSSSSPVSVEGMAFHKLMGGLQNVGNSNDGMSQQGHPIGVRLNSPATLNLSMTGHLRHQQQAMGGLPLPGIPVPQTHLDQLSAHLDFAERAARFSSLNYGHLATQLGLLDTEKLSRAARFQNGMPEGRKETPVADRLQLDMNNGELVTAREESSVSDPAASGEDAGSNAKKRKAPPKGKAKETSLANSVMDPSPKVAEEEHSGMKRCRSMEKNGNEIEAVKPKVEHNDGCSSNGNSGQKQGRDCAAKSPEPPKDYIHVRARRGQATDSHSLAERVRREKISQRMKLLQDLVPGCNKVTGKAVMLDEIINYVQSLQRQVEFLSMKLATVNPHLDFNNLANLLPKDMHQAGGPMPNSVYSLGNSEMTPPYINQPQQGTSLHCALPNGMETQSSIHLLDSTFHQNHNTHQQFIAGFENTSSQVRYHCQNLDCIIYHKVLLPSCFDTRELLNIQLGAFWEEDLQNATHMNIGQN
ncbi:hypothetical protein Cni_G05276 [Canna indica]|uniref:BHLH domain-containing protein n=1 Tax=Canna indica TaxID=4628 RepID=A0AAQ3JWQ5_9LILI|nr:hypothetical protein Cni_G05276 [Canna indica]